MVWLNGYMGFTASARDRAEHHKSPRSRCATERSSPELGMTTGRNGGATILKRGKAFGQGSGGGAPAGHQHTKRTRVEPLPTSESAFAYGLRPTNDIAVISET